MILFHKRNIWWGVLFLLKEKSISLIFLIQRNQIYVQKKPPHPLISYWTYNLHLYSFLPILCLRSAPVVIQHSCYDNTDTRAQELLMQLQIKQINRQHGGDQRCCSNNEEPHYVAAVFHDQWHSQTSCSLKKKKNPAQLTQRIQLVQLKKD